LLLEELPILNELQQIQNIKCNLTSLLNMYIESYSDDEQGKCCNILQKLDYSLSSDEFAMQQAQNTNDKEEMKEYKFEELKENRE